jgi:hypothetical protein
VIVKVFFWEQNVFTLKLLVDPKVAEVMATLHAIIFSIEVGFFYVVFEGDALQVVCDINSAPLYSSRIGHFIESINQELGCFRSSCVVFVPRECNVAAHTLVKEVVSRKLNVVWLEETPNCILSVVLRDQGVPRS